MNDQDKRIEIVKGSEVTDLYEARLFKVLDSISVRLSNIEVQLHEVVRLEERVKNHEEALTTVVKKMERHEERIRHAELWQANNSDNKTLLERVINEIHNKVSELENKIEKLQNYSTINKTEKKIGSNIFKWISGILAGVLIWLFTMGYKNGN